VLISCVRATNSKSATLEHYALYISRTFTGNSNAISNKSQQFTHDEPLLDQTQAGMREEEARQVVLLRFR
jgi:hypothetical protein